MNGARRAHSPPAAVRWAIGGGGILGMTLAWRLARAGHAVVLFEAAPEVGGLASAWRIGDVVWDKHYHVTLSSDLHLRGLLAELGLERDMRWAETRTGFFHEGRIHSLSNLWDYLTFPPLGLWDKVRLGATILRAARLRDGRALEAYTAEEWLTRWSGPRTVATLWRPLLRAKLGDNAASVSARFIWATIARLYQARSTGMKSDRFGYVPGGYARILARSAERLGAAGVEIRTGHTVARVEAIPGGGVRVTPDGQDGALFDRVALTLPPPIAASVCPQLTDQERQQCEGIRYQGIICASLLLRRPLHGFYVLNLTDPALPFTGVIEMSALVDRRLLGDHHLIYLPRYVAPSDAFWALDDGEIRRRFVAGLRRIVPDFRDDDIVCFQVSRVRYVLALPVLRYSDALPPMQTSIPGVWLISSAHIVDGTLNTNETVRLANAAASLLLRPDSAGVRT
jgi:protoporphyrinogen oxidase